MTDQEMNPEDEALRLLWYLQQEGFDLDALLTGKYPKADEMLREAMARNNPEIARLEAYLAQSFKEAIDEPDVYLWFPQGKELYARSSQKGYWNLVEGDPVAMGLAYKGEIRGPTGTFQAWSLEPVTTQW